MDEMDLFKPMIEEAKRVIPEHLHSSIRPVVCGGDVDEPWETDPDEDFGEDDILLCRAKAIELLTQSGFGDPFVVWSPSGITAAVVADLKAAEVYVEHEGEEVGRWPIHQGG
ncbi:hypothetical protein HZ994_11630 [Akkermansiaceae bacterium]|nr:hypothetical protein HZ994_11630 [Akkermansiaceae bacterium]